MRKPRLFFILYLIFVLLIARAMIFVLYLFIHTESMAPHRGSSWHRLNKSLIQDAISIDPTLPPRLRMRRFLLRRTPRSNGLLWTWYTQDTIRTEERFLRM